MPSVPAEYTPFTCLLPHHCTALRVVYFLHNVAPFDDPTQGRETFLTYDILAEVTDFFDDFDDMKTEIDAEGQRIGERYDNTARPAVDRAWTSFRSLDRTALTEIRNVRKPSAAIVKVVDAVHVLTAAPGAGLPPAHVRDWAYQRKAWSNLMRWMGSIESMLGHIEDIPRANIETLKKHHLSDPSVVAEGVTLESVAAGALLTMVRAVVEVWEAHDRMQPEMTVWSLKSQNFDKISELRKKHKETAATEAEAPVGSKTAK